MATSQIATVVAGDLQRLPGADVRKPIAPEVEHATELTKLSQDRGLFLLEGARKS